MALEKALSYIHDDALVEVTPKSIRLRKTLLDPNDRKRAEKQAEAGRLPVPSGTRSADKPPASGAERRLIDICLLHTISPAKDGEAAGRA